MSRKEQLLALFIANKRELGEDVRDFIGSIIKDGAKSYLIVGTGILDIDLKEVVYRKYKDISAMAESVKNEEVEPNGY